MNMHVRSRKNSRIVTQSLLNLSEQGPNYSTSILLIDDQFPKSATQVISKLSELKNNTFLRSTTLSFQNYSSLRKKSSQVKKREFMEEFLKQRQISLTKVSLRYNRINMALNDASEDYNKTCFMSKKLRANESNTKSERKKTLTKHENVNSHKETNNNNNFLERVYINPLQQKANKLKSINDVKRKYTFFGKINKTIA